MKRNGKIKSYTWIRRKEGVGASFVIPGENIGAMSINAEVIAFCVEFHACVGFA
jgi:hypothetical protein